eukprot:9246925-Pyramimonas_sp.AAC.1
MVQEVARSQDPPIAPTLELAPEVLAAAPAEVQQMVASPIFVQFQELLRSQFKAQQEATGAASPAAAAPPAPPASGSE